MFIRCQLIAIHSYFQFSRIFLAINLIFIFIIIFIHESVAQESYQVQEQISCGPVARDEFDNNRGLDPLPLVEFVAKLADFQPTEINMGELQGLLDKTSPTPLRLKGHLKMLKIFSDYQFAPLLAIRELVSNALDSYKGPLLSAMKDRTVNIRHRGDDQLEIIDQGVGMSLKDLAFYLLTPTRSSNGLILADPKESNGQFESIGRFGQGFFSVLSFLKENGDKVDITTQKEGGKKYKVTIYFDQGDLKMKLQEIPSAENESHGTSIHIKSMTLNNAKAKANRSVKEDILKSYFKFNRRGIISYEGENINTPEMYTELKVANGQADIFISSRPASKDHEGGKVIVTINGVKVQELAVRGENVHEEMALNLPANTVLTEDRGTLNYTEPANREIVKAVLDQLIRERKFKELNTLAPLLDGDHFDLLDYVKERLSQSPLVFLAASKDIMDHIEGLENRGMEGPHFVSPLYLGQVSNQKADHELPEIKIFKAIFKDKGNDILFTQHEDQNYLFIGRDLLANKNPEKIKYLTNLLNLYLEDGRSHEGRQILGLQTIFGPKDHRQWANDDGRGDGDDNDMLAAEASVLESARSQYRSMFEVYPYRTIEKDISEEIISLAIRAVSPDLASTEENFIDDLSRIYYQCRNYYASSLGKDQLKHILLFLKGQEMKGLKDPAKSYIREKKIKDVCRGELAAVKKNYLDLVHLLEGLVESDKMSGFMLNFPEDEVQLGLIKKSLEICDGGVSKQNDCKKAVIHNHSFFVKNGAGLSTLTPEEHRALILSIHQMCDKEDRDLCRTMIEEHTEFMLKMAKDSSKVPNLLYVQSLSMFKLYEILKVTFKFNQDSEKRLKSNLYDYLSMMRRDFGELENSPIISMFNGTVERVNKKLEILTEAVEAITKAASEHQLDILKNQFRLDRFDPQQLYKEWERWGMINENTIQFFWPLLYGDKKSFQETVFDDQAFRLFDGVEAVPVHEDRHFKEVFFEDVELNRKMLLQAIKQNPDKFAWIKETIKNAKEAGSSTLNMNAYKDKDGHMVVEIEDEGSGLSPEQLKYIYIPNFSSKEKEEGDINFGRGFYTLLNSFDQVMVDSTPDGRTESHLLLHKEGDKVFKREKVLKDQDKGRKRGTKIILREGGRQASNLDFVMLKTQLMKLATNIPGIQVTFNHERLPELGYSKFNPEGLLLEMRTSIQEKTVMVSCYQSKYPGTFYNGQFLKGDIRTYLNRMPPLMQELYKKLNMELAVNLQGELRQNANRTDFIDKETVERQIERVLASAILKASVDKFSRGEMDLDFLPYDIFYDFRTFVQRQMGCSSPKSTVILEKIQMEQFAEIETKDLYSILSDERMVPCFFLSLPMGPQEAGPKVSKRNILQFRQDVSDLLAKQGLLDTNREYIPEKAGEFGREKIYSLLQYQLVPEMPRTLQERFVDNVLNRVEVIKKVHQNMQQEKMHQSDFSSTEIPKDHLKEQETILAIDEFLNMLVENLLPSGPKVPIKFYSQPDGSQAHTARGQFISFNLQGEAYQSFKRQLARGQVNFPGLMEIVRTLTHELVHFGEAPDEPTHNQAFYAKQKEYNKAVLQKESREGLLGRYLEDLMSNESKDKWEWVTLKELDNGIGALHSQAAGRTEFFQARDYRHPIFQERFQIKRADGEGRMGQFQYVTRRNKWWQFRFYQVIKVKRKGKWLEAFKQMNGEKEGKIFVISEDGQRLEELK